MTYKDNAIFKDVAQHFAERLQQLVRDTRDTCAQSRLTPDDCVMLVTIHLWYQLARAAHAGEISEADFVKAASLAYCDIKGWLEQQLSKNSGPKKN
jgi:hypothetical protein